MPLDVARLIALIAPKAFCAKNAAVDVVTTTACPLVGRVIALPPVGCTATTPLLTLLPKT
jgi:hypothetical protein